MKMKMKMCSTLDGAKRSGEIFEKVSTMRKRIRTSLRIDSDEFHKDGEISICCIR